MRTESCRIMSKMVVILNETMRSKVYTANTVPDEETVGSKVGTPSFLRRGDSKVEGE